LVTIDLNYQLGYAGEEIDFTYAMYMAGRDLVLDTSRVAWHMAGESGGYGARPEYRPLDYSYFGIKWGFGQVDGLRVNTYKEKP